MFSKQEAVDFVHSRWGLQRVEERLSTGRTALLDDIVAAVQSNIPFQSVTLMALPLSQRKRPSLGAVKEENVSGVGGLCYSINIFTWGLLNALGFSAQLCSATVTLNTASPPDTHAFVLVNDLEKKGDLHFVDCATGVPSFRAVSLNFEDESPVFVDSFLEYKFIRHEGQVFRMHGEGDRLKHNDPPVEGLDFQIGRWRRFFKFSVRPTDNVSDFDAVYDQIYTVPGVSPFHHTVWALAFPSKRAVILVNNRLMLENDDGKLETIILEGDEQIVDAFRQYFPTLKEETVRQAIDEWHKMKHSNLEEVTN